MCRDNWIEVETDSKDTLRENREKEKEGEVTGGRKNGDDEERVRELRKYVPSDITHSS